jgi:hypothetical protein
MHKITFKYKDTTHEGIAKTFTGKRHRWYLINLCDGLNFVVVPAGTQTVDHKVDWLQENIPGETVHPKEFIQAVGSGLEAAGLVF